MRKHICFEAIDCPYLNYVNASSSWVCLRFYDDISTADCCMKCKFDKLERVEREIRKGVARGGILRLA